MNKKYEFESWYVDISDTILEIMVNIEPDKISYRCLINTYNDPYVIFYCEGICPADKNDFEKHLFEYLKEKYPGHF